MIYNGNGPMIKKPSIHQSKINQTIIIGTINSESILY